MKERVLKTVIQNEENNCIRIVLEYGFFPWRYIYAYIQSGGLR